VLVTYLRVVVVAMRLSQPDRLSNQLARAIRETKSTALLPLRVIVAKAKEGRLDFVPSPQDLFRLVRGDEWADWLDLYLGQKQTVELLTDELPFLVESLASMSGERLLERLVSQKRGIAKFFELLKEENLVEHYYRLLEGCLFNEESIRKVDEFYFRKVYFNFEYQEIIDYVVHFHENLGKPPQELGSEEHLFGTLDAKVSLLARILEIDPDRLFDLEKYIFYPEFNANKRFKAIDGEAGLREGHKLVQVLVDIIRIVSLKNLPPRILGRVFRALTALLKHRRTEAIVVAVTNISDPSFGFLSRPELPQEVWAGLSGLFEQIISGSYIYDLVIRDNSAVQGTNYELFYPLRYSNTEF
jgi:hypothetical protein